MVDLVSKIENLNRSIRRTTMEKRESSNTVPSIFRLSSNKASSKSNTIEEEKSSDDSDESVKSDELG